MSPAQLQRMIADAAAHQQAGRFAEAAQLYAQLRQLLPENFDVWQLSGAVALQAGRPDEAAEFFVRGLKLNPRSALATMRLGVALTTSGRAAEAETYCRQATELDATSADAWTNLALCLKALNRAREAIDCHHRALTLQPSHALGWYQYGLTLSLFGRFHEALRAHERALEANPTLTKGHYGRAQALQQLYRLSEAVAAYDHFLALEPGSHEARSYRLLALNHLDTLTREQLFAEHVQTGRAFGDFPTPKFAHSREPERRLRVAILSPDLRLHSCAFFLEPLLRHLFSPTVGTDPSEIRGSAVLQPADIRSERGLKHRATLKQRLRPDTPGPIDHERFELCLYHDHVREDDVTARFKSLAAVWRNFAGQPNAAVEKAIRADAPDLIVDLAGHTGATTRLSLFARHLAPVQINYLGYPNTTGLPAMQYRFTDAVADPVGDADAFATEKLVRFSPTAWVYEPPADSPATNGRGDGPVVFGSFNSPGKISATTAVLWARVLAAVPESRLFLKGHGLTEEPTRAHYLALFVAAGLPAERIELADRTDDIAGHLAQYHRVDVALDPFPYHGTTTTCEALWMGVPVVTLRGDRHASRVGASLLTTVGHPEWIAANADDYVRIAAGLAGDRAKLAAARASLRGELQASALFDYAGQAARFGAALRECWREYCRK